MTKNLVAKYGTVVHASSNEDRKPVLCSTMWRDHRATFENAEAKFSPVDAPVSCKDCCRILGIEAPKTLPGAKRVAPVLDSFEVGGRIVVSRIGEVTMGTITKLTKSSVTYLSDDAPIGRKGQPLEMAMARTKAWKLNA
jgi:hypothetical protein